MFEFLNPFRKSRLQTAIKRGMATDGDLADELQKLDGYKISLRRDADAICEALETISHAEQQEGKYVSDLHALVGLFQDIEDFESEGFEVLCQAGLPELVRIADASLARDDIDDDDLLFVLKVLASYGTREGAERLVAAARKPLKPDGYMWSVILGQLATEHPQQKFVFGELSNPLPEQFIAVSLLDAANRAAREGLLDDHPFDSPDGVKRLSAWLTDDDPEHFSYAVSAAASLPFIRPQWRNELLQTADHHQDSLVRLEAAWARAKCNDLAGIDELARICLDVNLSDRAQRYLHELGRPDAVPPAASDADFRAKADFANWLAHPNELGRPPDELEIVDQRTLNWPPEREPKPFWLIRYVVRDKTGLGDDNVDCGVVGSMTFCFFTYKFNQRPPEDCYAIHCYWEMKGQKLIEEAEITDSAEYVSMLSQWPGEELESVRIVTVAELSHELHYPQKLVSLASARRNDQEGWLVLDGPRSAWYPQTELPDAGKFTVLGLHVGRQLLGFTGPIDRKQFLTQRPQTRDPQRIVKTYERLFVESETEDDARRAKLLADYQSPLFQFFDKYVEARATVDGVAQSVALVSAYERFLNAVRSAGDDIAKKSVDELSTPLREQFQAYVDALVALKREPDVLNLIEYYRLAWNHNLGYGLLGTAAFKIKDFQLAEHFFLKLRHGLKDYWRSEEMSHLADIWAELGKTNDARELLTDCLNKLVATVKESKYQSDRQIYEKEFQCHRSTFLRLFPDLGEQELRRNGIPVTTAN